ERGVVGTRLLQLIEGASKSLPGRTGAIVPMAADLPVEQAVGQIRSIAKLGAHILDKGRLERGNRGVRDWVEVEAGAARHRCTYGSIIVAEHAIAALFVLARERAHRHATVMALDDVS